MAEISDTRFAQLDLFLVPHFQLPQVLHIARPLASQHFIVAASFAACRTKATCHKFRPTSNKLLLKQHDTKAKFVRAFEGAFQSVVPDGAPASVDSVNNAINTSFKAAASDTRPLQHQMPKRPWISQRTQSLICGRCEARIGGNYVLEKNLNKEVRQSAKRDRAQWLDTLAGSGNWDAVRQLYKKKGHKQGRLRDSDGNLVSSESRADTMAAFLEKV